MLVELCSEYGCKQMIGNEQVIEDSIKYLAKAIQSRADGEKYFPIFERLEQELEAVRSKNDVRDRIRKLAETS